MIIISHIILISHVIIIISIMLAYSDDLTHFTTLSSFQIVLQCAGHGDVAASYRKEDLEEALDNISLDFHKILGFHKILDSHFFCSWAPGSAFWATGAFVYLGSRFSPRRKCIQIQWLRDSRTTLFGH